jgi:hypothetical protein
MMMKTRTQFTVLVEVKDLTVEYPRAFRYFDRLNNRKRNELYKRLLLNIHIDMTVRTVATAITTAFATF